MADEPATRKLAALVVGAEPDGAGVVIRYAPVRGARSELEDRVSLVAGGDLASVHGVGRVLRVLRAGRVKAPADPWELGDDPESTAALLCRCRGALVMLHVARRFERVLTIWTDQGVSRIDHVIDVTEDAAGLSVLRRGGDRALRIPRRSLIRFAVSTREHPEIISVEVPTKASLR
jgi:hypothetical protein